MQYNAAEATQPAANYIGSFPLNLSWAGFVLATLPDDEPIYNWANSNSGNYPLMSTYRPNNYVMLGRAIFIEKPGSESYAMGLIPSLNTFGKMAIWNRSGYRTIDFNR